MLALALELVGATETWAYDFEVTARTIGQGYQLRRYGQDGIVFLNRRRITQHLGLRIFNLLDPGQDPFQSGTKRPPATLTLHAMMRFNTDIGIYVRPPVEITGIENNQFDLMLGALEGRNILGVFDFSLGRQYDSELMDLFAYDGLRLRFNSPWHIALESHFGLQVMGQRPFSATVFELDGVSEGADREALNPTFGFAIASEDLRWVSWRAAYRGVISEAPNLQTGDDEPAPLWGIDQELLFFSAALRLPWVNLRPYLGLRYNILLGQVDDLQTTWVLRLGDSLESHLEYLRSRPHFDGDSIFNIFSTEPYSEMAGRSVLKLWETLLLDARYGYRWFWSDAQEGATRDNGALTLGVGATVRRSGLNGRMELYYLGGEGGTTLGGDLLGSWRPWRRVSLESRVSLIKNNVAEHPDRDLLSFGLQVGTWVQLVDGVRFLFSMEDNISRLFKSNLRLIGILDLEFTP